MTLRISAYDGATYDDALPRFLAAGPFFFDRLREHFLDGVLFQPGALLESETGPVPPEYSHIYSFDGDDTLAVPVAETPVDVVVAGAGATSKEVTATFSGGPAGTKDVGKFVFTITVDSAAPKNFDLPIALGDTPEKAAANLVAVLNADAAYSASATGAVVKVTLKDTAANIAAATAAFGPVAPAPAPAPATKTTTATKKA